MKTQILIFMTVIFLLSGGFVACEKSADNKIQATGTVIGYFIDQGYGSLFLQVDEKFPIGETIEYFKPEREFYYHLLETGTYNNVIQVQHTLPIKTGNKMSFSVREYNDEKDFDLFFHNGGIMTMEHVRPSCPMYVITEYKILNN